MKLPVYISILFALVCLPLGCSDDATETDAQVSADQALPADAGAEATFDAQPADITPDQPVPADTTSSTSAGFCGHMQDKSGAPIAPVGLILCNEQECFDGISQSDGHFCVNVGVAGDYLLHATDKELGGKHYGDVMFPVALSADDVSQGVQQDVGDIIMPELGAAVMLDPQQGGTLALGAGMTLTIPPGATIPPPLSTEVDVAIAKIENAWLHPLLLAATGGRGDPAAAFLVVPVGVTFSSPISFQLPISNQNPGDQLEILWVNDETGQLESHGEAQVTAAGSMSDVSGKGLTALGWFLFYPK